MQPSQNETVLLTGLSNREFLERYACSGRIGLSGGITLVDKAICRAERHVHGKKKWGAWSHAFLFKGERHDGHHCVPQVPYWLSSDRVESKIVALKSRLRRRIRSHLTSRPSLPATGI